MAILSDSVFVGNNQVDVVRYFQYLYNDCTHRGLGESTEAHYAGKDLAAVLQAFTQARREYPRVVADFNSNELLGKLPATPLEQGAPQTSVH